jgi:hypothetical protein
MIQATTSRANVSQKAKPRCTSRPVLWGLRRRSGLYEPIVFGTRQSAEFHAAAKMDGLKVVALYAKSRASK